jgi:hypothetical protein
MILAPVTLGLRPGHRPRHGKRLELTLNVRAMIRWSSQRTTSGGISGYASDREGGTRHH